MTTNTKQEALVRAARAVRTKAYAPYSAFAVGAALLAESGRIYTGANVESASYGATLCAERAALAAAVAAGERRFDMLAVAGGELPLTPCGICRQLLSEFLSPGEDLPVVCAAAQGDERLETTLRALLPSEFGAADLQNRK